MAEMQNVAELDLRIRLTQGAKNKLVERANRIGRPLNDYASELLERAVTVPTGDAAEIPSDLSPAAFDRALDDFFGANPEKLPALPSDFSRDDIYAEHD